MHHITLWWGFAIIKSTNKLLRDLNTKYVKFLVQGIALPINVKPLSIIIMVLKIISIMIETQCG